MTLPTNDQDRADAFRSRAQMIILTWMRECRIKTPMSDVPDVLMHLTDAVTDELEKTYQDSRRSNSSI